MAAIFPRKYPSGKTVWYLDYVDHKGDRQKDSLGEITKQQAKALLAQKKAQLLRTTQGNAPTIVFGTFMEEYLRWYSSQYPDSYTRCEGILRLHFKPSFSNTPLNLLTRPVLLEWRDKRINAGEVSRDTVNKELITLKAMLERAVDTFHHLDANPLAKQGRKNVRDSLFFPERGDELVKFLEKEQLEDLYKRSSPRNAALWKFMANTGLRAQEMAKLFIGDVDAQSLTKTVRVISYDADPTKNRETRLVSLNAMALEAFHALRAFTARPDDPRTPLMRPMHEKSFLRLYVTDAKRGHYHTGRSTPNPVPAPHLEGFDLPLNESSLHCLRHTFGAHMAMAGVDLRALQKLMGHKKLETTMIYANVSRRHLMQQTEAIAL